MGLKKFWYSRLIKQKCICLLYLYCKCNDCRIKHDIHTLSVKNKINLHMLRNRPKIFSRGLLLYLFVKHVHIKFMFYYYFNLLVHILYICLLTCRPTNMALYLTDQSKCWHFILQANREDIVKLYNLYYLKTKYCNKNAVHTWSGSKSRVANL